MDKDNTTSGGGEDSEMAAFHSIVKQLHMATLVIYCIIFIFGIVGNGLVIYVTVFRMKRTVNSVWFLNLALADFLFTSMLIVLIVHISRGHVWKFGLFMCKFISFVAAINMFSSVFLLTAISVDRLLSVWAVAWARNNRTVRKAQILNVVIWIAAGVCSIPMPTFRTIKEEDGSPFCVYPGDLTIHQQRGIYIHRFVVGFLIPFLIIMVSYVAIGIRARQIRIRKQKSLRIISSVILAFFFCWVPFHIFSFIELNISKFRHLHKIIIVGMPLTNCLAYLNSCLNPILYVFMCEEFQKKLRQSICSVFESALSEDNLTSQGLATPQFHRTQHKKDLDSSTSVTFAESRMVITEETPNSE